MIILVHLVIITIAAVLLANGGLLLIRRSVSISTLESHNDVAGFIYAVIGVLYAVLLAFVVDTVWEMHRDAEAYVDNEVKTIMDVYSNAHALPEGIKKSVHAEIRNYVKLVVEKEWESMSQNRFSKEADSSFHRIRKILREYKPPNDYKNILHDRALETLIRFGDNRNLRLLAGRQSIPPYMWIVLILCGALTIGFSFLFGTKNLWAQIVMVSSLTAMIALILTLIWGLESPFSGIIRVEPDAFKLLLEEFAAVK